MLADTQRAGTEIPLPPKDTHVDITTFCTVFKTAGQGITDLDVRTDTGIAVKVHLLVTGIRTHADNRITAAAGVQHIIVPLGIKC